MFVFFIIYFSCISVYRIADRNYLFCIEVVLMDLFHLDDIIYLLSKEKRKELVSSNRDPLLNRCLLSHEKWQIKSRIPTDEVDRETVLCESHDTVGLYDRSIDPVIGYIFGIIL